MQILYAIPHMQILPNPHMHSFPSPHMQTIVPCYSARLEIPILRHCLLNPHLQVVPCFPAAPARPGGHRVLCLRLHGSGC